MFSNNTIALIKAWIDGEDNIDALHDSILDDGLEAFAWELTCVKSYEEYVDGPYKGIVATDWFNAYISIVAKSDRDPFIGLQKSIGFNRYYVSANARKGRQVKLELPSK